jgi:hypothetical protein
MRPASSGRRASHGIFNQQKPARGLTDMILSNAKDRF